MTIVVADLFYPRFKISFLGLNQIAQTETTRQKILLYALKINCN